MNEDDRLTVGVAALFVIHRVSTANLQSASHVWLDGWVERLEWLTSTKAAERSRADERAFGSCKHACVLLESHHGPHGGAEGHATCTSGEHAREHQSCPFAKPKRTASAATTKPHCDSVCF